MKIRVHGSILWKIFHDAIVLCRDFLSDFQKLAPFFHIGVFVLGKFPFWNKEMMGTRDQIVRKMIFYNHPMGKFFNDELFPIRKMLPLGVFSEIVLFFLLCFCGTHYEGQKRSPVIARCVSCAPGIFLNVIRSDICAIPVFVSQNPGSRAPHYSKIEASG